MPTRVDKLILQVYGMSRRLHTTSVAQASVPSVWKLHQGLARSTNQGSGKHSLWVVSIDMHVNLGAWWFAAPCSLCVVNVVLIFTPPFFLEEIYNSNKW